MLLCGKGESDRISEMQTGRIINWKTTKGEKCVGIGEKKNHTQCEVSVPFTRLGRCQALLDGHTDILYIVKPDVEERLAPLKKTD